MNLYKKHWLNCVQKTLLLGVLAYRMYFSHIFGGACRFTPTCSQYAFTALNQLPLNQACLCILKRLLKCVPFGSFGFDPPPKQK